MAVGQKPQGDNYQELIIFEVSLVIDISTPGPAESCDAIVQRYSDSALCSPFDLCGRRQRRHQTGTTPRSGIRLQSLNQML
jgi:hypothetical protein